MAKIIINIMKKLLSTLNIAFSFLAFFKVDNLSVGCPIINLALEIFLL